MGGLLWGWICVPRLEAAPRQVFVVLCSQPGDGNSAFALRSKFHPNSADVGDVGKFLCWGDVDHCWVGGMSPNFERIWPMSGRFRPMRRLKSSLGKGPHCQVVARSCLCCIGETGIASHCGALRRPAPAARCSKKSILTDECAELSFTWCPARSHQSLTGLAHTAAGLIARTFVTIAPPPHSSSQKPHSAPAPACPAETWLQRPGEPQLPPQALRASRVPGLRRLSIVLPQVHEGGNCGGHVVVRVQHSS